MTIQDKQKALQEIELFRDADAACLTRLATMCREVSFPKRTTIFEEFELATDVYFITGGKVSLSICDADKCREMSVLDKGDLLGWSPLIGRTRLFDTALAETPVKALAVNAEHLLQFCKDNPDFGYEFMRSVASVLGERLIATRRQLAEANGIHLSELALETD